MPVLKNFCRFFVMAGLLTLSASVIAQEEDAEIGIIERLGSEIPLDVTLTDSTGSPVLLRDLITKPTALTFVYYRCPGICSPLLNGFQEVIDRMEWTAGNEYQAIAISFNPEESAELARDKKANYFKAMNRPVPEEGWRFLVADASTIETLTRATGFRYKKDEQSGEYLHSAALITLSPGGKIARYLYGITFLPFDLKMALTEASLGKTGPTINKMLKFCFSYDPAGRTYVLNVTRIGGTLTILFAIIFILWLTLRKVDKKVHIQQ